MSDPTAGTRGFVAGLIKAMEFMPEGEAHDQVQAICDGVQARDGTGPVHFMTEDGIAVWVQPKKARWWVTTSPPDRPQGGGGAARDTRDAALAGVPELLELMREGVARRAGEGKPMSRQSPPPRPPPMPPPTGITGLPPLQVRRPDRFRPRWIDNLVFSAAALLLVAELSFIVWELV